MLEVYIISDILTADMESFVFLFLRLRSLHGYSVFKCSGNQHAMAFDLQDHNLEVHGSPLTPCRTSGFKTSSLAQNFLVFPCKTHSIFSSPLISPFNPDPCYFNGSRNNPCFGAMHRDLDTYLGLLVPGFACTRLPEESSAASQVTQNQV